jgi:hypothetical protein
LSGFGALASGVGLHRPGARDEILEERLVAALA